MIWLVGVLLLILAGMLGFARYQAGELRKAQRINVLLTLAMRQPESVAGRDILDHEPRGLVYDLLTDMEREGAIERYEWGQRRFNGKPYKQFRYRLTWAGFNEVQREWR